MDGKNITPTITAEEIMQYSLISSKNSAKFPKQQMKVYQMLLRGKCSVGDISAVHRVSDPRGHIRDLREKGVAIMDEWCKGSDGVRFKRYWIEKEERQWDKRD